MLSERVITAQKDEIALMQRCYANVSCPYPRRARQADAGGHMHHMRACSAPSSSRSWIGARQGVRSAFLTFMIQHHSGAVTMVEELFRSEGAALDDTVFKLAFRQLALIKRPRRAMQQMLAGLSSGHNPPDHREVSIMTLKQLSLTFGLLTVAACAPATSASRPNVPAAPTTDPRIGLRSGQNDAAEATWNLRVVAKAQPTGKFVGSTNSDLAFLGNYAIQGNYNGFQVWDISNPSNPTLKTSYYCPASQSDVSVYKNLLFVSGEGLGGRLDCAGGGVKDTVSADRLRGLRIFDIADIANPKYIGNVQTCRGSHTHTVFVDPKDAENVYVYISGSAPVRSPSECRVWRDSTTRSRVGALQHRGIKVPLANRGRRS